MTEGGSIPYLRRLLVPHKRLVICRTQSSVIVVGSNATTECLRSLRQLKLRFPAISIRRHGDYCRELATRGANDILTVEDQQKEGPFADLGSGQPLSMIPLFPLFSTSFDNVSDHTMCLS